MSKLIRVPNSIHGDTGLIARVFELKDAESFEPLRDCLMPSGQEIRARFLEDVPELPLQGKTCGPFGKGDVKALNLSVAAFYVLKGSAEIIRK